MRWLSLLLLLLVLGGCLPASTPVQLPAGLATLEITSEGRIHAFTLRGAVPLDWVQFLVVGDGLSVHPEQQHTAYNGALVVTEHNVGNGYALYVGGTGVCANVVFTVLGSDERYFLEGCAAD